MPSRETRLLCGRAWYKRGTAIGKRGERVATQLPLNGAKCEERGDDPLADFVANAPAGPALEHLANLLGAYATP